MITYRVTLIEEVNDMKFDFDNYDAASRFIRTALNDYVPNETERGYTTLVAEIEMLNNEPF